MKIESQDSKVVTRFDNVIAGQVFRSSSGEFYLRMFSADSSGQNAVNMTNGITSHFPADTGIFIIKEAVLKIPQQ